MWNMGMSGVGVLGQVLLHLLVLRVLGLLAVDIFQVPLPLVTRSGVPA
jgi:hypothetical protein